MQYLFLIPLIIAILLALGMINSTKSINVNVKIEKPFTKDIYNDLHVLSYRLPFEWFVNPNEEDSKVADIKNKLVEANLTGKYTYRSFITLQILILISSIILIMISFFLIDNSQQVIRVLFNVRIGNVGDSGMSLGKVKLLVMMIFISLALMPKVWLKNKANSNKYYYLKDIPIVQLFIILMLRSKRTLGEVMYMLSKTNTRYKLIFETGYRIFLRDKNEGFEYIKSGFKGTKFEETIQILQDYNEYSYSDSISILENNMAEMIEFTNNLKRKNDLSKLVFSQGSLFIPFLSIILLGLVPFAIFGMSFLSSASQF